MKGEVSRDGELLRTGAFLNTGHAYGIGFIKLGGYPTEWLSI